MALLLLSQTNMAQTNTNTRTTSTTTTTVNGVTTTNTATSVGGTSFSSASSGYATGVAFASTPNDTIKWKTREVSKDFNIKNNVPIFIESSFRNIEVKTWDQPTLRLVAVAQYKNDEDANRSLDELFEKSNIKVKNSDGAFEILGANSNAAVLRSYTYTVNDLYSNSAVRNLNLQGVFNNTSDSSNTFVYTPNYTFSTNVDTSIFLKDSSGTNLKIIFKPREAQALREKVKAEREALKAKRELVVEEQVKAQAEQIKQLSKQISEQSKKLAALSAEDAEKNSKEIAKLTKEIAQLSNQITFKSLNKTMTFNFDTVKTNWETLQPLALSDWNMPPTPPIPTTTPSPVTRVVGLSAPRQNSSLKWTIYIPQGHKVNIDSKYGNINIDNDLDAAKITSRYGNVETKNIKNLVVSHEYGNVYVGNLQNADLELRSVKFKSQNAENIKINSKNSSVDMEEAGTVNVESSNDDYDISSVKDVNANKNYGSFRLTTLNGKMRFTGANADIKVRNISPKATNIDITNKFAKIALPFSDVKNYNVVVTGSYNNSFDDFNNKTDRNKGFAVSSGNGKDLNTNINCNNCSLDFK